MKFRNHHKDARDIPSLGLVDVPPGGTFEATGEAAESLLAQGFPRADKPKPRKKAAKKAATVTPNEARAAEGLPPVNDEKGADQ